MGKTFYITTPIYYVNAEPHIGHAYTTITADILARFHRMRGEKVLFATGTDEHATKVEQAAKEKGLPTREFVDRVVQRFINAWGALHIEFDDFIRTPEERHKRAVWNFFRRLLEQGDIYKGTYDGWYCLFCETFLREDELVEGNCPDCGRSVSYLKQPAYFFRLSAYRDRLLQFLRESPEFIKPEVRYNEVVRFVEGGLKDVCISRRGTNWGVPLPGEEDMVVYVWFDALINYLTVPGYGSEGGLSEAWPPDVQLMAKDILTRFHATLWPGMLMGHDLPLPKLLFAHGFWTVEGEKMSKSRGNVVDPVQLSQDIAKVAGISPELAADALRYFLLREVPFGMDGDFSYWRLVERYDAELAKDLGNLVNRIISLAHRYTGGKIPEGKSCEEAVAKEVERASLEVERALGAIQPHSAISAVFELLRAVNRYLDERRPWTLATEGRNEEVDKILYTAMDAVRAIAVMLRPIMPVASKAIFVHLSCDGEEWTSKWEGAKRPNLLPGGRSLPSPRPLYPRLGERRSEIVEVAERRRRAVVREEFITIEEFKKVELVVATVKGVSLVPGADKLLKLTLDAGPLGERTVVAGTAKGYRPEDLVGKQLILVANLRPAKIRGIESQGMILAAGEEEPLALLILDRPVPPGTRIR